MRDMGMRGRFSYGPAQGIKGGVGCRDIDSVVEGPDGIYFQSKKGRYLLTLGWTMKPVGLDVADYDSETVVSAHHVDSLHELRWLTSARMIVFDYLANTWSERTIASAVHAAIWQGTYHYLVAAGPLAEQTTWTGTAYGIDVETAWIQPAELQGAVEIRKLMALGEYRSGTIHVRARVAYDYNTTWIDDRYWAASPTTVGGPLQVQINPSRQKMEAIKLRLTVVGAATQATMSTSADLPLLTPTGHWTATFTAIKLGTLGTGLSVSVGVLPGTSQLIDVRDNQIFNAVTGLWADLAGNIGVQVVADLTHPVTIGAIEAAINAYSDLIDVTTPHGTPTAILDITSMAGQTTTIGSTAGGAFAAPTGESIKLTGLAMEIGIDRPGLYKRLPPSQRV